jgi:hypothetical protein
MHISKVLMALVARSTMYGAAAAALLTVSASSLRAQDECQCTAPGAESSRLANAIGGGLFAGLLAAVIPFHGAIAAAPPGAGGPSALTLMTDSTDIAPSDSARPRELAMALAPEAAGAPLAGGSPNAGAPVGPNVTRTSNGEAASPLPSITPDEAAAEGMIAPKTATLLPTLTMIGIGALVAGIFFIRVRRPRLRSR